LSLLQKLLDNGMEEDFYSSSNYFGGRLLTIKSKEYDLYLRIRENQSGDFEVKKEHITWEQWRPVNISLEGSGSCFFEVSIEEVLEIVKNSPLAKVIIYNLDKL